MGVIILELYHDLYFLEYEYKIYLDNWYTNVELVQKINI